MNVNVRDCLDPNWKQHKSEVLIVKNTLIKVLTVNILKKHKSNISLFLDSQAMEEVTSYTSYTGHHKTS